jgi:hypothetical protein
VLCFENTGHTEGTLGIISLFSFLACSCNGAVCTVIRLWDEQLTNITSITNGQRNVYLLKIFKTNIPFPLPPCHKVLHRGHFNFALLLTTSSARRIFRYGEYLANWALNVCRNGCWSSCKQSIKFICDINPYL